jgi:hypothetical protein
MDFGQKRFGNIICFIIINAIKMWYPIRILRKAEREMFEQEKYYQNLGKSNPETVEYDSAYRQLLLAIRMLTFIQKRLKIKTTNVRSNAKEPTIL